MQTDMLKRLLPALAVGLTALSMLAQTTTQGSIAGSTLDTTGAIIPTATVKIVNNATNVSISISPGSSGDFTAPLLDPGDYTVTVTAPGFGAYQVNHVVVQVGQTTRVDAKMTVGSTSSVVEVTGEAPILNFESPSFSSNINSVALENIPINNRRWSALALTTPGVTVDTSGFGLVSVRGISTIMNNVEIDGADDNQAYFSEERGRTREAYSTSASAVREFAVNTGVYPAEYGRAAGGVINSVTKSGTNELHGEIYFYDRESNWAAYLPYSQSTVSTLVNGTNVATLVKPEDLRKIYGFTADGALIKNKLFWIYTYDQHTHVFPLLGVPASPALFYQVPDVLGATGNTACTAGGYLPTTTAGVTTANAALDQEICTLAARLSYSHQTAYGTTVNYANAATLYNSGISALAADIGLTPRFGYQEINTPKLDWEINDKEHFSILYHRLRWDSPGGVQTTSSGKYSFDSTGNDFVKLDYGVTKLISEISPHVSNELLYQYGRELNDEGLQPITPYDTANLLANGNDPYVELAVGTVGFYVGAPYYGFRPAYPEEWKWQIGDDLYYEHGRHDFKFGVDMVHNYDYTNNSQYYEGEYDYGTYLTDYFADLYSKGFATGSCNSSQAGSATSSTTVVTGAYPCYTHLLQDYGPPTFGFSTLDQGYFAQDDWKATPRLTMQLGLRYDYEALPDAVPSLTAPVAATATNPAYTPFPGVNNNPSDKVNFGPRIGFSYDVFGTGKTVLRGGYGLYYGRITNGNQGYALANTGSPLSQSSSTVSHSTGLSSEPIFPYILTPAQIAAGAAAPTAYFRASNLKNPQVDEFDLMVQQEVGRGTVFQIAYLGSLGRDLPNFLDVNLNPAQTTETLSILPASGTTNYGPLGTASITVPTFTSYGNTGLFGSVANNFQAITELISNINSNYNALAVEVQNRSLHSLQFDVNYTWAHALDYSQNASTAGNTNNWYNPYGDYRVNYGNSTWDIKDRLAGYAVYSFPNMHGGNPLLHYLVNDWKLDTSFQMQTGLPYAANAGDEEPTGAINDYLNGNGNVSIIPQLGFNNYFSPRVIVDDMRLEKDLLFRDRYRLELIGQAFNVANHRNATEIYTEAYALSGSTMTYQGDFGQTEQSNNSGFSYTPREIEISARLAF